MRPILQIYLFSNRLTLFDLQILAFYNSYRFGDTMTTTNTPQVSDLDKELQERGEKLIKPTTLPKDFPPYPPDYFHSQMNYGSTNGMTAGAKSQEYRRRAVFSTLRSLDYEKVLAACLAYSRLPRMGTLLFALVWGGAVLSFNWSKVDQLKASVGGVAAVVPALAGNAIPMTPEQARAAQKEELRKLFDQAN